MYELQESGYGTCFAGVQNVLQRCAAARIHRRYGCPQQFSRRVAHRDRAHCAQARLMKSLSNLLLAGGVLAASSSCGHAATEGAEGITTPTAVVVADPLYEKMLALDTALFDSFNKCSDPAQLAKHAAFFDQDVEFYHDLGGLTRGVEALLANTRENVCGKLRRQLDVASLRVYPIRGFGAMSMGTHRFCHTPTTCEGIGEFTTVWREKDGVWQVTRALSYAHRALDSAPTTSSGK